MSATPDFNLHCKRCGGELSRYQELIDIGLRELRAPRDASDPEYFARTRTQIADFFQRRAAARGSLGGGRAMRASHVRAGIDETPCCRCWRDRQRTPDVRQL